MRSVYETISRWARMTTSSMTDFRFPVTERAELEPIGEGLIYRLKHWPELPALSRTAGVYGTLSVMSNRPVNRRWILAHSKLQPDQVDRLMQRLIDQDAVEVIDGSKYPGGRQR
jgi:hypothetical protein